MISPHSQTIFWSLHFCFFEKKARGYGLPSFIFISILLRAKGCKHPAHMTFPTKHSGCHTRSIAVRLLPNITPEHAAHVPPVVDGYYFCFLACNLYVYLYFMFVLTVPDEYTGRALDGARGALETIMLMGADPPI